MLKTAPSNSKLLFIYYSFSQVFIFWTYYHVRAAPVLHSLNILVGLLFFFKLVNLLSINNISYTKSEAHKSSSDGVCMLLQKRAEKSFLRLANSNTPSVHTTKWILLVVGTGARFGVILWATCAASKPLNFTRRHTVVLTDKVRLRCFVGVQWTGVHVLCLPMIRLAWTIINMNAMLPSCLTHTHIVSLSCWKHRGAEPLAGYSSKWWMLQCWQEE